MIEITERYNDYEPPINVTKLVQISINNIPSKYVASIQKIVLTNRSAQNRSKRRAYTYSDKKKISQTVCNGLYHRRTRNTLPYIELFIDNIFGGYSWIQIYSPFLRPYLIAHTLFHEIGHHIQNEIYNESRHKEFTAEHWRRELSVLFMSQHYPLLCFSLRVISAPIILFLKIIKKYKQRNVNETAT